MCLIPIAFARGHGLIQILSIHTHPNNSRYFAYADAREGTAGGHGTHVCGSLAGYPAEMKATSLSFAYRGAAWGARLAFFDVGSADQEFLVIPPDLASGMFARTYVLGGRIHSDSWGSAVGGNSEEMHQTDNWLWERQDFVVLYAAGNDGGSGDGGCQRRREAREACMRASGKRIRSPPN